MAKALKLDFDNLPLVEAAVRASFNGPTALSYRLINSVHSDLSAYFPDLAEAQQLEIAPGAGEARIEFGPGYLPGAVYGGHASGLSVHLQPQVVVARWTKRPANPAAEYPRYPALRDSIWRAVEAFRKGSGDEFPGIAVVNMSYVNFIPRAEPARVIKKYFSTYAQLPAMDNARQIRKLEGAWSESDKLDVRFSLEQAEAKLQDGVTPGYRLTTAAGLRLGEALDAKSGLDKVHESLQEFFLKLISKQAQEEWKLRGIKNA
jgi:uncharacterized protein (TIGR04255 family)